LILKKFPGWDFGKTFLERRRTMTILLICIFTVVGILAGMYIGASIVTKNYRGKYIGTLVIDRSDPDEPPYIFSELVRPIHEFKDQKFVVMNLENKNYVSHD
jgi:hypothetical protein